MDDNNTSNKYLPTEKPPDLSFLHNDKVFDLASSRLISFDELIKTSGKELNIEFEFFFPNLSGTQWGYMKIVGDRPVKTLPLLEINFRDVIPITMHDAVIGYDVKYCKNTIHNIIEAFIPNEDVERNKLLSHFSVSPQVSKSKDELCNRLLKTIILTKAEENTEHEIAVGDKQGWNIKFNNTVAWESRSKYPPLLQEIIPLSIASRETAHIRKGIFITQENYRLAFKKLFHTYKKLKNLFLLRVASYMLTFASNQGVVFNQIISIKPDEKFDNSLLVAMLDNVYYGRGNIQILTDHKRIKSAINTVNDAILLAVDDTLADEKGKREEGCDCYKALAVRNNSNYLQIPVVISDFAIAQFKPEQYCDFSVLTGNFDISPVALSELLEWHDSRFIERVSEHFCEFIEIFNRIITEISSQTPYFIPAQRRNIYYILIAALRTYDEFFGVFFDDEIEHNIIEILGDYNELGNDSDEFIVELFAKALNDEIGSGKYHFIKRKKYIVFDQGTDTVIVDDDYVYFETDTIKNLSKDKLKLHSVNSLTDALNADESLNINMHNSKCYKLKVQTSKGGSYNLYAYGVSKLLINAENRKRLDLADKEKFLLTREELLQNSILPLGITADGRFVGKDIAYINKSNNSMLVTGRSGRGKSFNVTNSLPILKMLGCKLTVYDVSCSFRRDEVLRAFDQDERLVDELFVFIEADKDNNKLPYHPLYVGDCKNLPAKKRRVYGFVTAITEIDKDSADIIKDAISTMLQRYSEAVIITKEMLTLVLRKANQYKLSKTVSAVLDNIAKFGYEEQGFGDFINSTSKIPIISLGDKTGATFHSELDALISSAFEWQRDHNTSPLTLVLDEIKFQNFSVGSPLHTLLTQSRKFNMSLIGMTQELVSRDSHSYYIMREADIKVVYEPANSLDAVAVQLGFKNAVVADLGNLDKWEFYLRCDAYNKEDSCNDRVVIRCYTVKFKDTPYYDEYRNKHGWKD